MEVKGTIFKAGNGWWLARLQDGRVAMCHYRQRSLGYLNSPEVGDTVKGVPEKTERGWRLVGWEKVWPARREPSPEEKALRSRIDDLQRELDGLRRYADYPSKFEAWRRLAERSGLIPTCPQCGAEVAPHIELTDRTTSHGRSEWSETWTWSVNCSCGFSEQFASVSEMATRWEPESEDGYRGPMWLRSQEEWVVGKPALQFRVRHERRIDELCEELKQLRAQLRNMGGG